MKKVLAALAATLAFGVSSAAVLTLDDFSINQGPLKAGLGGNPNPMCDNNGTREMCEASLTNPLGLDHKAQVQNGFLNISNETLSDTEVTIRWNIAAGAIPASSASGLFNFLVLASDGNPTNIAFSFNGASIFADAIAPNTFNQTVSFSAPIGALAVGGVLELKINGSPGWDLVLDQLDIDLTPGKVPTPGIALLLGAGLLGFGALRRKA